MLDDGSVVLRISEKVAAEFGAHFEGIRIVFPIRKGEDARVVGDGRELAIKEQTRLMVNVTNLTTWTPVEVKMILAVLPGVDYMLIIGSKSVRGRFGVGKMASLGDNHVKEAKERRMSPTRWSKWELL